MFSPMEPVNGWEKEDILRFDMLGTLEQYVSAAVKEVLQ